jgi:hypothetical protein
MKIVKILGAMIGNIDEDNAKLIHDFNRKSQMMEKGFKHVIDLVYLY